MLELISVEVENFRSFTNATFTPLGLGQGMTAINGPNGSGKSSLATHAVLWALYGITPDGVPVKAMRRQNSTGEVKASVTFRHDGQEICVSRYLKGKNDTTIARIMVDGIEQTNISARTAAAWVARRLGVDAEGFATAFVVRQKELDALIRARPAERRALIERLAGIHHMSEALTQARERARVAQSALAAFAETTSVEELAAREQEAIMALDAAEEALAAARAAETAAQHDYEQARNHLRNLEEVAKNLAEDEGQAAVLREKLSAAGEEKARLSDMMGAADILPDAQAALASVQEEIAELEETVRQADAAALQAERDHTTATECESRVNEIVAELEAQGAVPDEVRNLASMEPEIQRELTGVERQVDDALAELGGIDAEIARLTKSLELFDDAHGEHEAECPTCQSPLTSPERLVATLNSTLLEKQEERAIHASLVARLQSSAKALRDHASASQRAQERLASAENAAKSIHTRLGRAQDEMHRAVDRAESSAEAAHSALAAKAEAEERLPAARAEALAASSALRKAEAAQEAAARIVVLEAKEEELHAALTLIAKRIEGHKAELSGESIESMRAKTDSLLAHAVQASATVSEANAHALLLRRDAEEAQRALEDARASEERRIQAETHAENALHLAAGLDEFRRDRIARLAPELSEVASDLLLVMTDGRYSSIELDEDFTPIATEAETGLERPAAWLSGGEESAVALALRIAIGEVVAGQRGGLLVLDEVLTAQDQLRRSATMAAIRALPRQVITINHVSEATDMVDLVAQVVPDGNDGSLVEQFAPSATAEIADFALMTSD